MKWLSRICIFSVLFIGVFPAGARGQSCADDTGNYRFVDDQCEWTRNAYHWSCSDGSGNDTPQTGIKYDPVSSWYSYVCFANKCNGSGWVVVASRAISACNQPVSPRKEMKYEYQCSKSGSIINVQSEVLGESIPLLGADFKLNYFTNYAHRIYDYRMSLPPNDTNPSNLVSMAITFSTSIPTSSTQNFSARPSVPIIHDWDGNGAGGLSTWGSLTHTMTSVEDRGTYTHTAFVNKAVGSFKAIKLGLGGWLPSIYHFYDKNSSTLYKGNGGVRVITVNLNTNNQYIIPEKDGSYVYTFDSVGRLLETKLGVTGAVIYTFGYNGFGQLASITQPYSRVTTFNRDGNGKLLSITTPYNKTTIVNIDANGFMASLTSPGAETYSMAYNVRGILLTFTRPNGTFNTFTYDAEDRLTKDEHSSGYFTSLLTLSETTTSKSQRTSSKMGRNHSQSSSFRPVTDNYNWQNQAPDGSWENVFGVDDATDSVYRHRINQDVMIYRQWRKNLRFNNLVHYPLQENRQLGTSTRMTFFSDNITYSNPGDPFAINTWTNTKTVATSVHTSVYTGATKTFVNTSPLNRTTIYQWDDLQRPLLVQQGTLTPTTFSYTNENLTGIAHGARVTTLNYDPVTGLLSSILNPLSQMTSFVYDSAERLSSVTLPDSRVINYMYNSNGELQTITPTGRPVHAINYGLNDLISNYVPPSLAGVPNVTTTYIYNDDKQLTEIVRPDGQNITYAYNASTGNLTAMTTPQRTITYLGSKTYLSSGTLQLFYGPSRAQTISYSGGEIVSLITSYPEGSNSTYSRARNTTNYATIKSDDIKTNGISNVINYGYDADELLISAGSLMLAYDVPNGQLTTTTLGDITDSRTYNTFGELISYQGQITGMNHYSYTVTRDGLGRISTKSQTMPGGGTDTYAYVYDLSGRLEQVTKNGSVVANYVYDNNNNRVSGNMGAQVLTGVYDSQDRMISYNVFHYEYNANGELKKKTNTLTSEITNYTYDAMGNLTKVILPNATVIDYDIDGLNRRVGKSVDGVLQRRYQYMDQYRIVSETNPNGTILRRYVYASRNNIPDYYIEGGIEYKIFADHLGSFRLAVNVTTGATVCAQDNDEFGRVTLSTVPGCLPFGFAGGLYDADTGLVRFGARDYDPETGRWLSKDPIRFDGRDTNLYGYVMNDPVNFIDPTGLILGSVVAKYFTPRQQVVLGGFAVAAGFKMMYSGFGTGNLFLGGLGLALALEGGSNINYARTRGAFDIENDINDNLDGIVNRKSEQNSCSAGMR